MQVRILSGVPNFRGGFEVYQELLVMTTKTCNNCKLDQPIEEFNQKRPGKLNAQCKNCTRQRAKAHYQSNKQYYKEKAKARDAEQFKIIAAKLWDYLLAHPCVDCGNNNPLVLEFDHIQSKFKSISQMKSMSFSWNKIQAEIDKCEVRCANCHRIKTRKQLNWYTPEIIST